MKRRWIIAIVSVSLSGASVSVAQEPDAQRTALDNLSQRYPKLTVRQKGKRCQEDFPAPEKSS